MAEEELARTASSTPGAVAVLTIEGPPWYDEYTGLELPEQEVDKAMEKEMTSLAKFEVKTEVPVCEMEQDEDAVLVPSRWLIHRKATGIVKVRLVAQQVNDGSLQDTFAATPSSVGQRFLLLKAAECGWPVMLGDVSTAFLHAPLGPDDHVYLQPPPNKRTAGVVWRLHKALYGLRSAPRLFQEHMAHVLEQEGFRRGVADPQLYWHSATGALVSIHADDILVTAKREDMLNIQALMTKQLVIKWAEEITETTWVRYLGREWRRTSRGYEVRLPPHYVDTTLALARLQHAKGVPTPSVTTRTSGKAEPLDAQRHARYRALVGRLMWLMGSRPDMCYPVKELARAVSEPTTDDELKVKRVLKYLSATRNYVLKLEIEKEAAVNKIDVMVDASWANEAGRRSTSGGLIRLHGFPLAWWSKTQQTVAQSTCEAELIALNLGGTEGRFVQNVLSELDIKVGIELRSDSTSAVRTTTKRGPGSMKHLEIKELWLQDEMRSGRITISRVSTENNVADLFTKHLPRRRLEQLVVMMKLSDGAGDPAQ
jgi:hypothetical protein